MAFSDGGDGGQGVWDNNDGLNFYARVRMPMTAAQRSHTVDQALAEGPAWGNVQVCMRLKEHKENKARWQCMCVCVCVCVCVVMLERSRAKQNTLGPVRDATPVPWRF